MTFLLLLDSGVITTFDPAAQPPDEMQMIHLAQRGNLASYNSLVLLYQERVYQLASRFLRDTNAAEDISQAVFIRAFQKLSSYRGGCFRAWLLQITSRLCLDEIRKTNRHPLISLDEEMAEDGEFSICNFIPAEVPSPEDEVMLRELKVGLDECLETLPLAYRIVIELVDIQGLDYKEAAEILECPVGTVKSRLARARLNLGNKIACIR
jgi:RNA polymerase sigma-70 factor (ECF subfamily)